MLEEISPLADFQEALRTEQQAPADVARIVADRANHNASRNTYIRFEAEEVRRDAERLTQNFPHAKPPLFSVPISLKDCFDRAGTATTCGTNFYRDAVPPAREDSAMASRLARAGALITGKTHLHPLAYGITGQNPEYGDCLQPRDAGVLTGGSSSGAAASVQEGSALAAIGTDTGGSIRVPAALCGLVGYRASHSLAEPGGAWPDAWRGAAHLAPSFDTVGFLLVDPRDAAPIANALFGVPLAGEPPAPRIGFVNDAFLADCAPEVLMALQAWKQQLPSSGASLGEFETTGWEDAMQIFAPIQAAEAAEIHRGYYEKFEPAIRDRLKWGASLDRGTLEELGIRRHFFCESIRALFQRFDLLMLPCAPVSQLPAGVDLSDARKIILRYTTPFSLAGLPAVSLPGEMIGAPFGTGVQIAAPDGADAQLLAFAAAVGKRIANSAA